MPLRTKMTDKMRAIKMTYKKGMGTITDIRVFEFPDHLSEDFIKGFQEALKTNDAVERVERIDTVSTNKIIALWQTGQVQAIVSRVARVIWKNCMA